jgi:PAS domain-containing protein
MNNQRSSSGKQVSAQARRSARFNVDLSTPMIFCVAEAVILLILLTALNLFAKSESNQNVIAIINVAVPIFYLLSAGILCVVCAARSLKTKKAKQEANQLETEIYDMFRYIIDVPYAVMDGNGRVMIMNGALQDILGYQNAVSGIDFSEFCSISPAIIIASAKNRDEYLTETGEPLPAR